MEFGFSAGIMYNKYDKFRADRENNCYPITGHEDGKWGPMLRDIHVALVYRFGNYPIQKKYRWRYDVDMDFREKKDSIYNAWLSGREQKYIQDSIYRVVSQEFKMLYDSCVDVRHREQQRAIDEQAPARVPNYTPKQLAKMRKDSIKQARLDSISAIKKAHRDSINAIKKARRDSLAAKDPKLAKKFAEEDAREAKQQELRDKIERNKKKAKSKAKDAQAAIERQRAKREAEKKAEASMTKEEKAAARKAKAQAAQEKIARMRARREAAKKAAEAAKNAEEGGAE
jgi:DNA repair exonuclease SbcCD ATPase subunit